MVCYFSFTFFLFLLVTPTEAEALPIMVRVATTRRPIANDFFPAMLVAIELTSPSPSFIIELVSSSFRFPLVGSLVYTSISDFFDPFSIFPSPFACAFLSTKGLTFVFDAVNSIDGQCPINTSISFEW